MPNPKLFVEFDQSRKVFFPGQTVSGRVILMTSESYKAISVYLKLEGLAHTHWSESESHTDSDGRSSSRSTNYSATVRYLYSKILLWVSGDGSNRLIPGTYVWPFSYRLPSKIPPSFEGTYGYIRYSVTAKVDRPWTCDETAKRCITVSHMLDLNLNPNAMVPLQDRATENLGCCCFKKGYLSVKLDIPKTGFVPGETVPINLHIVNKSFVLGWRESLCHSVCLITVLVYGGCV